MGASLISKATKLCVVVVTYFPEREDLASLLQEMSMQVPTIVILDNNSSMAVREWLVPLAREYHAHLILHDQNIGVAAAHNEGIRWAKENDCSHVILFDQDSGPNGAMVARLLELEQMLLARGVQVGAIGPQFRNSNDGASYPFIRLEKWRIRKDYGDPLHDEGIVPADYLITSGSLIRLEVFDAIGLYEEDLFIDYVDIEWGLRAKSHGFRHFGVCTVEMRHRLGGPPLKLFGGRITAPARSPLRHYYHFRNAVSLYRRGYIPWKWSLNDGARLAAKFIVYSTFTNARASHFKMMLLGLFHGLTGRMGKRDAPAKKT
jgi:rhamnosyltransferase